MAKNINRKIMKNLKVKIIGKNNNGEIEIVNNS